VVDLRDPCLASLVIAGINLARDESQRISRPYRPYVLPLLRRLQWWQQTLWKLRRLWGTAGRLGRPALLVRNKRSAAAFSWHSDFVQYVVQPSFLFFGPLVYAAEVFIGHLADAGIGHAIRRSAGALMARQPVARLYRTPNEWPWTYFFLIVIQLLFVIYRAGRVSAPMP